ncbi:MAG TPA: PVC-type heme-binding CxxCH protein [Fimbriiglobus sp.]|jgi:quinoprotein glucose dehydrogenase
MPRRSLLALTTFGLIVSLAAMPTASAQRGKRKGNDRPSPDDSAKAARVAGGLKVEVWAAEPLLANPVCFAFDENGKCYVAETYRHSEGVTDTRNHMNWLDDDMGSQSVADRVKMFEKWKYPAYPQNAEQVRVVWDSTGSGKADKSAVFAGGFNRPEDGIGAGLLARKGSVYYTCIPDLYQLKDTTGDNKADVKKSLISGFGVHVQFLGHDLHGLRMGPDGKLYFSVGDRGYNITTSDGKHLMNVESGAVLRCDPDGKNLEVVHTGLRNPQELAFDDYGNLFTYDNNSDSGDMARWVQIVEGGDSGWRCGYQFGTLMHHEGVPQGNRGPFNTEHIWYLAGPNGPPAFVVPPIALFGNGPAGLTHYPGIGLNDKYKDHFFACDFKATTGQSVIWSLAVKPKGASFEVVDRQPFVRNMVPTDCEFGPDGAFYWSDWIGGWDKPKAGRIFKVSDPEAMINPHVAEAQKLIAEGMGKKTIAELVKLLEFPHQQVRLEAQYELTTRPEREVSAPLIKLLTNGTNLIARLHAVWALTKIQSPNGPFFPWDKWMGDEKEPAIRAALAQTMGRFGFDTTKQMSDADPRVRFFATLSYGKRKPKGSDDYYPLFDLLKTNNDADPYLRHAAVQALFTMTEQPCDIVTAYEAAKDKYDVPAVRLGIVLALRKLQCQRIGQFLTDPDPRIVAEAARAINDTEMMAPMEDLAKLAEKPGIQDVVAYRALNANFKLGQPENAVAIAGFIARTSELDYLRVFALKLLADWAKPPRRDAITGLRQELPDRPAAAAKAALLPMLAKAFVGSDKVRAEAVKTVSKLGIAEVGSILSGLVADPKQSAGVRVEALFALDAIRAKELKSATAKALADAEPRVRAAARVVAAKADPTAAAAELPALLKDPKATAVEKQMAFYALGQMNESKSADDALASGLDALIAGKLAPELKLDLIEAAQTRANNSRLKKYAPLQDKLAAYDKLARAGVAKDPLSRWRDVTNGGDAEKGKQIFLNSAAVYCQRCHKFAGQGGEVGPELTGIGSRQTRDYLLESLVDPNKDIAKGFASVILNLEDGRVVSGVLRSKTDKQYVLVTAEGKVFTFARDDVASEKPDRSAMPDDLVNKLTRREIRDVVEFLTSTKVPAKK